MKKTDILLIIAVLAIIAVSVLSNKGTLKEEEIEFPLELAGEVGLNEISYDTYKEMVDNGDAFILVIERTGCSWCQQYMPIVSEVADEKKIAIVYLNTDNLSETDLNDLETSNRYLKKNQWGTPTTIFMLGERIVDSIGGYVDKDKFLSFIADRVVIGE